MLATGRERRGGNLAAAAAIVGAFRENLRIDSLRAIEYGRMRAIIINGFF